MIVDTSALLAYFDTSEPRHADITAHIDAHDSPPIVSPHVIAELDHVLRTHHDPDIAQQVIGELAGGAWELATIDRHRLARARALTARYAAAAIDITDATLVILADDYGADTIATLNRRHFGTLRLADGSAFRIVP